MRIFSYSFRRQMVLGCLIASVTGCAEFRLSDTLGRLGEKRLEYRQATPANPAVEILALWQPAEGQNESGLPTRGFAGQIMFFTRGDSSPVKVDGDMRIYLFDDVGTPAEQAKPIHQFDFKPEIWNLHLQQAMLGPSYNIFIPYVRKDHHQVKCVLSARFTPADGPVVHSKLISITLPGPHRESESKVEATNSAADSNRKQADRLVRDEFAKLMGGDSAVATSLSANDPLQSQNSGHAVLTQSISPSRSIAQTAATDELPTTIDRSNDDKDRLRRLEGLVERLLEQGAKPIASSPNPIEGRPLDESVVRTRFKLNPADQDRHRHLSEQDRHPLAEVGSITQSSSQIRRHPLADEIPQTIDSQPLDSFDPTMSHPLREGEFLTND